MRKTSKLLSLALTLVMVFSMTVTVGAADTTTVPEQGDIVVLYANDIHCAVDGYASLAGYRNAMKEKTEYVSLVDAGDAIQGEAIGTLSKGQYLVDIMNQVGYDVIIPGNHEFDYGMERFLELAGQQKTPYICCNFMDLKTGKPVFDAYRIVAYGETKVAYVGIDTPETYTKSTPVYFQDEKGNYIYGLCEGNNGRDLYNAVQSAIDAAKAEGAQYVIAVGHCGIDAQSAPWRSTDIIANVSGLTAFIDGHSHSVIPSQEVKGKDGKTVLLTSTGTKFANVGKLVLKPDGAVTTGLVAAADITEKDETVDAFVKGIQAKYEELVKQVVGKSAVDLTINGADGKRAVRNSETNMGDFVADAYRVICGSDIGICQGGGVRADIPTGDFTYEQVMNVNPWGNALSVVEVKGQVILDALEHGARTAPGENGGFFQVSGLSYTVDLTVESSVETNDKGEFLSVGDTRRVKDVTVGGKAIDPNGTYTVASTTYILSNDGDGMTMFSKNAKVLQQDVMIDYQALISYVEKLGGTVTDTYAKPQGRITLTGALPFTDVDKSADYYTDVAYVYANNIFKGFTETTFAPDTAMTRGQMVTVLWRLNGSPASKEANPFTDVAEDSPYVQSIAWAKENGIANGYTDTSFAPNQSISRQQFLTILYRYAGFMKYDVSVGEDTNILSFTDANQIGEAYIPAMQWACGAGVLEAAGDTLAPTEAALRSQVAGFLANFSRNVIPAKAA